MDLAQGGPHIGEGGISVDKGGVTLGSGTLNGRTPASAWDCQALSEGLTPLGGGKAPGSGALQDALGP